MKRWELLKKAGKPAVVTATLLTTPIEIGKDSNSKKLKATEIHAEHTVPKVPFSVPFPLEKQVRDETPVTHHEEPVTLDQVFKKEELPVVEAAPAVTPPGKETLEHKDHQEQKPVTLESFGKLAEYMDLKFFRENIKTPSDTLEYVRWARSNMEGKKQSPFRIFVNKKEGTLSIVNMRGRAVLLNQPILRGKKIGDKPGLGYTPAGLFDTYKEDNELLRGQHPKLYGFDVPASAQVDNEDYYLHDTLYNIYSSKQVDALKPGASPMLRHQTLGCIRLPGDDKGVYDIYFKEREVVFPDGTKDMVTPALDISPEEEPKKGLIRIIDDKTKVYKDVTRKEYERLLDAEIHKKP